MTESLVLQEKLLISRLQSLCLIHLCLTHIIRLVLCRRSVLQGVRLASNRNGTAWKEWIPNHTYASPLLMENIPLVWTVHSVRPAKSTWRVDQATDKWLYHSPIGFQSDALVVVPLYQCLIGDLHSDVQSIIRPLPTRKCCYPINFLISPNSRQRIVFVTWLFIDIRRGCT